ncbi:esterase/lipase family protein [Streptomyces sp. NPDC020898]|uniref:esterase/lipase family protein n=1 Tax=Streptomyces sp. NPDC020898 TaxID=3365101 RepID=UPI0037B63DC5
MAITFFAAAPANAAPIRSDGSGNTVLLIHGFDPDGAADTNCAEYWGDAITHFSKSGWNNVATFGYYSSGPENDCNFSYSGGTRETSITSIAKLLADTIYYSWTINNEKIDVVAHSMGGLVIRSMLYHVANGTPGWPTHLYIEDVVTLGTPHDGAAPEQVLLCRRVFLDQRQCTQMTPGSAFLRDLPETPSSGSPAFRTDWTVVSSFHDFTTGGNSGVGVNAGHKIQYQSDPKIGHSALKSLGSGSHRGKIWHKSVGAWSAWGGRAGPLEQARKAVYHQSSH